MKKHAVAWIALGLLLAAPTAQAELLNAEKVTTAGQVTGLQLRLLELRRSSEASPWPTDALRVEAADATLEAWYEDSGGTAVRINPQTERNTIYEGPVTSLVGQARDQHLQFLYSLAGAPLGALPYVDLMPHDQKTRAFPDYLMPTGAEENVPLADTVRAQLPEAQQVTVTGPATLVLWDWNITFEGSSGLHDAWSGTRPHGAGTSTLAPFGFDAQLLVLHIHNGTVTLPVPMQDLQALHLLVEDAGVVGSITTSHSWLAGTSGQAQERVYLGNHSMAATVLNETVLRVAVQPVEAIVPPAANASHAQPQGQVPQPSPARTDWAPVVGGIVLAAAAASGVLRRWQWRVLVTAFQEADYGHVAVKAGRFHRTFGIRGRAQTMTMVSALKLGQHQFVLHSVDRMRAIEPSVAAMLRGHARQALGLSPEPNSTSAPPLGGWPGEIDALDPSAAYS